MLAGDRKLVGDLESVLDAVAVAISWPTVVLAAARVEGADFV
jgi:hypothetical protein